MKTFPLFAFLLLFTSQTTWAQYATSSITGARVPCINSMADNHACNQVDLLARISKDVIDPSANILNDIWGWTDPDTQREYVLVGTSRSVGFVDVTDPVNPIHLGKLPSHDQSRDILWRDMKVYNYYMFVTVDGGNNGMQVFDLRQLRNPPRVPQDFVESAHYGGFRSAHNIAINEETGFAYIAGYRLSDNSQGSLDTCNGRGLHIVNIQNPLNPVYAGCFADHSTGRSRDGYTHDVQCVIYRGPDETYHDREICIGSNENHISIVDVTNKSNPVNVAAATYPFVQYTHQGWLTTDQAYFFMNDEADENLPQVNNTRTIIWDLSDLEDPVYHSSFYYPTESSDHNLYIYGDFMFATNYKTGLRIVNISDINDPREVAYFDTYPESDSPGYSGAWSSFRFPRSGTTVVNSDPGGMFILDPLPVIVTNTELSSTIPESFSLSPAYPNPFNPTTTATLSLPEQAEVRAEVLDMLGRSLHLLHDGVLSAGEHLLNFDAGQLPSGSYYIRVQSDRYVVGTRIVLIK